MEDRYSRTRQLIGEEGLALLKASSVLVVGVGGVGSYAAEAVARAGVGNITLMDGDSVQPSNLNRQLVALTSTLGKNKAEVMAAFDWVIDAIDSVIAKTALIKTAIDEDVNIVSAMGAAGKFDTQFKIADISKTSTCPLAKVMRKRLRDIGIEHLPVVFSEEKPVPREGVLGTLSYVPGSAGLCLAGYVIRSIAGDTAK